MSAKFQYVMHFVLWPLIKLIKNYPLKQSLHPQLTPSFNFLWKMATDKTTKIKIFVQEHLTKAKTIE